MQLAHWCICLSFLMPYFYAVLAKAGGRGFDNHAPRLYLSQLAGWRQRAHWCQENSFESFAPFAVAVILCEMTGISQGMIDILSVGHIAARIVYGICYVSNWAALRSLIWMIGFCITLALFLLPALIGG